MILPISWPISALHPVSSRISLASASWIFSEFSIHPPGIL
jgi:hypothetical protein